MPDKQINSIAVLSDIHGNLDALKSVLKDIKQENITKIFVCGDLAMAGAEPNESVEFLKNFQKENDVTIIQGNTDQMVAESIYPSHPIMAEAVKYAQKSMTKENIAFLKKLPKEHVEKIGNLSFLFVHGSPRKNDENISRDLSKEELLLMLDNRKEDIIFCGHTHHPVVYNIEEQVVINVGSTGRPFDGDPKAYYTIIEFIDSSMKNFAINQKLIPYNFLETSRKLEKLNFDGAKTLGVMLKQATGIFPLDSL